MKKEDAIHWWGAETRKFMIAIQLFNDEQLTCFAYNFSYETGRRVQPDKESIEDAITKLIIDDELIDFETMHSQAFDIWNIICHASIYGSVVKQVTFGFDTSTGMN